MSPPPPPPPPPLFRTLASPEASSSTAGIESGGGGSSISLSPSLLIIAAILAFVFVASASIHLLLRYLSRPSSPSSRSVHHHRSSSSSGDGAAVAAAAAALEHSEKEKSALIESLPLFTLASSLAALPKSSPDCAVCLSPFQPDAELRLLPACRHAFHADCIDTWLRSTPSCPLCRASIALPHPPVLQTPRSGSFRIEIGSISLRRTPPEANSATAASGTSLPPPPPALPPPPSHLRSYSIGSYDYFVEEEVEAVVPRNPKEKKPAEFRTPTTLTVAGAPAAPGEEVAEEAGGAGRAWLKDYVDRLASTASSSFSSLRFSGRWSHRFDGGGAPDSWWWDLEGNQQQQQREGEEAGYYTLYRWLVGI